ncbi:MAG: ATP-binding protein [Bacteroidales bacterium]|nr:ATP-binding protein [Bacteroidales bacterium]
MITKIKFENFTAFDELTMQFSPGINILLGENGTGKTHVMKSLYAACSVIDVNTTQTFDQKLRAVFLPNTIGRLVRRSQGRHQGSVKVFRQDEGEQNERSISCQISTLGKADVKMARWNEDRRNPATYIPVKDMLANAPRFRALYSEKHIHFEEVYSDIIDKALQPIPKGKPSSERAKLLEILNKSLSGKVVEKNETFYLRNRSGELEFTLLAEGLRKLGLLFMLIQNETLTNGSVLFWDEPEANLNPLLSETVVRILLELQKMGVQLFIATHDYVLLKEFELATSEDSEVLVHTLYRNDEGKVRCQQTSNFDEVSPNAIDLAFQRILDREINKAFEK